jgi:hypothetical protein
MHHLLSLAISGFPRLPHWDYWFGSCKTSIRTFWFDLFILRLFLGYIIFIVVDAFENPSLGAVFLNQLCLREIIIFVACWLATSNRFLWTPQHFLDHFSREIMGFSIFEW